jgi:hypothetical protein
MHLDPIDGLKAFESAHWVPGTALSGQRFHGLQFREDAPGIVFDHRKAP